MILKDFADFQILGKPLFIYLGIATLVSFLFTAAIIILSRNGINITSVKWHHRMAMISVALAFIHGILAYIGLFL